MLRTIGFVYPPNILGIFAFIPCLGWLISLVGAVSALAARVIAVRQALDFDTGKSIMTHIIGWIISFILNVVFGAFWRLGTVGVHRLFCPPFRYR